MSWAESRSGLAPRLDWRGSDTTEITWWFFNELLFVFHHAIIAEYRAPKNWIVA
jgi:hypothetical protein